MKFVVAAILASPCFLIALWCKVTGIRYAELDEPDNWLDKWCADVDCAGGTHGMCTRACRGRDDT